MKLILKIDRKGTIYTYGARNCKELGDLIAQDCSAIVEQSGDYEEFFEIVFAQRLYDKEHIEKYLCGEIVSFRKIHEVGDEV